MNIFQEIVQNGDDSGATTVKFTYDDSYYGTDSLPCEEMERFQVSIL